MKSQYMIVSFIQAILLLIVALGDIFVNHSHSNIVEIVITILCFINFILIIWEIHFAIKFRKRFKISIFG